MAIARLQPATTTASGSVGGLTIALRQQVAVLRLNNRRRRDASPREHLRIATLQAAHARWATLSEANRDAWNAAAAQALDPPFKAEPRRVSGSQLHTASYTSRTAAGAATPAAPALDAWVREAPVAFWFTPDLAAQTLTLRALDFEFPVREQDPSTCILVRRPSHRSAKQRNRASALGVGFIWGNGVPGFNDPPIVFDSPFPLAPAQRLSLANRGADIDGSVTWQRWVEVLTPPVGHQVAGYLRPGFFGLLSPSIEVLPGPVITIVNTIADPPSSFTRDFSSPPGQTVEDVFDWATGVASWEALEVDPALESLPASTIEPFGRSVVTRNWQPRALFVAAP